MTTISIGSGSASSLDPIDLATELGNSGKVSYLSFDCLSERTLTLAQLRRQADPNAGHDPRLPEFITALEPFLRSGGRIIGNFGAANPDAAVKAATAALREAGLGGTRVGVINGEDVRDLVMEIDAPLPALGCNVREVEDRVVSAHAYTGADEIVELLAQDAQIIIGGRLADPSMYVAPICHELGWALDDWERLGKATLVGHLLETGTYTTGGCFSNPPYRTVEDAHRLGMPMAEVSDESIVITKLEGTGGLVSRDTVRAMLAYEIHDPSAYLTPDVAADFTEVTAEDIGPDRVMVGGATGRARPDSLKVLVGLDRGWKVMGEMSFAGPGCVARAEEAVRIHDLRIARWDDNIADRRADLIGYNSLWRGQFADREPNELRLRISIRCWDRTIAEGIAREFEFLMLNGPAGGGGSLTSITPALGVTAAYVDRSRVKLTTEVLEA